MPVSGTFLTAFGVMVLHFDRPLKPRHLALAPWLLHHNLFGYTPVTIRAGLPFANTIEGNFQPTGLPAPPGTNVTYNPPPFDVTGTTGVPAAAFSHFPLTPI